MLLLYKNGNAVRRTEVFSFMERYLTRKRLPAATEIVRGFILLALTCAFLAPTSLSAQELEPRAYLTLPVGTNFFLIGYTRSSGSVVFDPTLPVEDVTARVNAPFIGYGRAIDFFGRSASLALALPYVWGDMSGRLEGQPAGIRRSGLPDPRFRLALNLIGGPALSPTQFAGYQQKTNLGVSVVVVAPLGQYDPVKLINLSGNRWAFKPEVGLSQALGKWRLDLYAGVWLFTDNDEFQGGSTRKQNSIGVVQGHISYNIRRALWAAFDATFYKGGRTLVDGEERGDLQQNTRFGLTLSLPLIPRHSIKFHSSTGAFTSVGADFNTYSVAYQYVWF